jgi:hypothetical protein
MVGGRGSASPFGVVGSPAVAAIPLANGTGYVDTERLFVASGSGAFYILNIDFCVSQESFAASVAALEDIPYQPLRGVGEESLRSRGQWVDPAKWLAAHGPDVNDDPLDDLSCVVSVHLFNNALFSSPRWAMTPSFQRERGIVFVSETDPFLDTGGVIHAYDGDGLNEVWNFPATFNGTSYGIQHVPALPINGDVALYIGFGPRFLALDANTGAILKELNDTLAVLSDGATVDNFVSSAALKRDDTAAYIHSVLGTLWRIDMINKPGSQNFSMNLTWGCDYSPDAGATLDSTCASAAQALTRTFELPLRDPKTYAALPETRTVSRGDMVSGGFYQATTRQERDELHTAIRQQYARREAVRLGLTSEEVVPLDGVTVAQMARSLPREVLGSIVTSSGYRLLAPNGRPAYTGPSMLMEPLLSLKQAPAKVALTKKKTAQGKGAKAKGRAMAAYGVDADGKTTLAAASASSIRVGPDGTFPYSTPGFTLHDASVVVAQYTPHGFTGVYGVDTQTGALHWNFTKVLDVNGRYIFFGKSRSSPAIDPAGSIYVASSTLDGMYNYPLLFALSAGGKFAWVHSLGGDGINVGAASPIVAQGALNESLLYMAATVNVYAVKEGLKCPSNSLLTACSNQGNCNCTTGKCSCLPCATGPDCSGSTCGPNGKCSAFTGGCVCNPCFTGLDCMTPVTCPNGGSCNPQTGQCQCAPCYSGPNCETKCNGNGQCVNNQCLCNNCYSGSLCDQTCSGNGQCVNNQCQCSSGCYSGALCDQECNGNGSCQNNVCVCSANCYSGPTCGNECNGNGVCNPSSGICTCNMCNYGTTCSQPNTCSGVGTCVLPNGCMCPNGKGPGGSQGCTACDKCSSGVNCAVKTNCNYGVCVPSTGQCSCPTGYDPTTNCQSCTVCRTGTFCGSPQTCSGNGVCSAPNGCACKDGWTGSDCSQAVVKPGSGGKVAAAILIPMFLIFGAAGGVWFWMRRNPTKSVTALLPQAVQRKLGMGSYQPLWKTQMATSSSSSAMSGGSYRGDDSLSSSSVGLATFNKGSPSTKGGAYGSL